MPQISHGVQTVTFKLEARRRVGTGKGAGRRIRTTGLVPAVLYGGTADAVNLAVEPKAIKQILSGPRGMNTTFAISVDGGETVSMARVMAIQKDPVRRTLVHCDLQRLDSDKSMKFKVPVTLDGIGPAEKIGATVRFVTRRVVVKCKPGDVPASVVVDTSKLGVGESIRLADLTVGDNMTLLFSDNAPVVVAGNAPSASADDDKEAEAVADDS